MKRSRTIHERSFPRISITDANGGRAVEVALLTQLDVGSGDAMALTAGARQRHHPRFNDALDEPSVRLSAPDIDGDDPASLFTFSVGSTGHPFHRHASSRLFTAISGSGGARLRFIPAAPQGSEAPLLDGLQHVEIPGDCLFTVRMAANTWHQFLPLRGDGKHPALFAVSCHPDETAGELDQATRDRVMRADADLASLTELLSPELQSALRRGEHEEVHATTTKLGFAHTLDVQGCIGLCAHVRRLAGRARQTLARVCTQRGFVKHDAPDLQPVALHTLPTHSLLNSQLVDHHYEDSVQVRLASRWLDNHSTESLLVQLLEAFIEQPAPSVGGLMQLRNLLVKPLGLRVSPLGCPVSSLLNEAPDQHFAQRFPVLDSHVSPKLTQVLLGADDRHLSFRSCVSVQRDGDNVLFTLSTRVHCRNLFGRTYMAMVDPLHRQYIAPVMLRSAAACLVREIAPDSITAPMAH